MSGSKTKLQLDPRCNPVETELLGPFVKLGDGSILTVKDNAAFVSADGGQTWSEPRTMYRGSGTEKPTSSGVLLRTREGTLVYVYMDMANFKFAWNNDRHGAAKDVRLDVWAIRSLDEGRTWVGRKRIFEGYCGALINMIQTRTGEIVVPIQRLVREPCRHCICVYVSADQGQSWRNSNIIDLGGHGHHDGAMEPTIVERGDGRLWMLIRTNYDQFWDAFSDDKGLSWRVLKPSGIDASSAPGYLARLASGRLALVWNRLLPKGRKRYPRLGGDCNLCDRPTGWHREELSMAFSADDGESWSEPVVIVRIKGGGPSYPHIFEPEPGKLWVSTLFRDRTLLSLNESDFLGSGK